MQYGEMLRMDAMTALRDIQADFLEDIYKGGSRSEKHLAARTEGKASRIDIYRNNMVLGLCENLAGAYPVVKRIAGDEFFKTIARHYIRQYPQSFGNRHLFGAHFSSFLADCDFCASLPYLSDMAAIEWAHFRAIYAKDADILDFEGVHSLLLQRPDICLALHPSACVVDLRFNALEIWRRHQAEDIGVIQLAKDDHAVLVWRDAQDNIALKRLSSAARAFVLCCLNKESFAAAFAAAAPEGCDINPFQQEFAEMLAAGVFVT